MRPLLALVVMLGLLAPTVAPSAAAAAPAGHPALSRGAVTAHDAVTGTVGLAQVQPLTSTSGLTVAYFPRQVVSGGHLSVLVRTLPNARVALAITFPDGTTVLRQQRAGAGGYARFDPAITYQPQGSAEAATLTVTSTLRSVGLADSMQGSVTVLQRIVLQGSLRLPRSVVVGHALVVTLISNQPGAVVRFLLVYPDGQTQPGGGYTDAAGAVTRRFLVSRSDGTGFLQVQAWLSFEGVQRHYAARIALLRARKP